MTAPLSRAASFAINGKVLHNHAWSLSLQQDWVDLSPNGHFSSTSCSSPLDFQSHKINHPWNMILKHQCCTISGRMYCALFREVYWSPRYSDKFFHTQKTRWESHKIAIENVFWWLMLKMRHIRNVNRTAMSRSDYHCDFRPAVMSANNYFWCQGIIAKTYRLSESSSKSTECDILQWLIFFSFLIIQE